MSRDAVLAFIEASDRDPALKKALQGARGPGPLREVARAHGYEFTHEEFHPIMEMLRFLHDAQRDRSLREGLRRSGDDETLIRFARKKGYEFSVKELAHLSMETPRERPLTDGELEAVAGGTTAVTGDSSSLRVTLQSTRQRTSTGSSFSEQLAAGLSSSADSVFAAGSVAAPYLPGGTVLSAALSGLGSLSSSSGS